MSRSAEVEVEQVLAGLKAAPDLGVDPCHNRYNLYEERVHGFQIPYPPNDDRLHCSGRLACLRADRHQGGGIEAFEDLARFHAEGGGSDAGGGIRLQADPSADELCRTAHASRAGASTVAGSLFER